MNIKHLTLTSSISRAQDSYGYNRLTLTDTTTGKKYACVGGGYDMTGTVFAEWMQDNYQSELLAIADKAYYVYDSKTLSHNPLHQTYYGMTKHIHKNFVSLDGACGLECMLIIAQAIGLDVQRQVNSKGQLIGFLSNH